MRITPEILAKLVPTAEGMDVYLDQSEPALEDPSKPLAAHEWCPACVATNRLTRCLEAIRDTSSALIPLCALVRPDADKRLLKQVITPVYNLAIAIRDLFNYVQSNCWTKLDKQKQAKLAKRFTQFGKEVPTGYGGVLKTARDKIAAHLDKDAGTSEYRQFWDTFGIADVLIWIRGCLRMFQPLLTPDLYSWTRFSGYGNVWNLMNADGWEWSLLIKDDIPERFIGCKLVVSPKAGIVREARGLAATCIALEQRLGISVVSSAESRQE